MRKKKILLQSFSFENVIKIFLLLSNNPNVNRFWFMKDVTYTMLSTKEYI